MEKRSTREFLYCAWIASFLLFAFVGCVGFRQLLRDWQRIEFDNEYPFDWGLAKVGVPASEIPQIGRNPRRLELWNDGTGVYLVNTINGLFAVHDRVYGPRCVLVWQPYSRRFLCPIDGSLYEENGRYVSGPRDRSLPLHTLELVSRDLQFEQFDLPGETGPVVSESTEWISVGFWSNGALPGRFER